MIKLINGRGQLGTGLQRLLHIDKNIEIYHTWNFLDKSLNTQIVEFKKFETYLDITDKSKKVIFISTILNDESFYSIHKKKAEALLQTRHNSLVIRLPNIIGKGVFQGLRDKTLKPFGIIKFASITDCLNFIESNLDSTGIIECPYWTVSAETISELLQFANRYKQ